MKIQIHLRTGQKDFTKTNSFRAILSKGLKYIFRLPLADERFSIIPPGSASSKGPSDCYSGAHRLSLRTQHGCKENLQ